MNYILRNTINVVFTLMLLSVSAQLPAQAPVINEFMSSNSITIADEDGDFEDWIELFFDGEEMISLKGYGLSDNFDEPFKWIFPDVKIQPGQCLLVWASGKDRRIPGAPLHTNFSIKADGEELLLTQPSGVIIDEIAPVMVPTDISYGRQPDGWGEWYFFDEPTPGESNATTGYSEILVPVAFSHTGAFYLDQFELELSHPDPEVTIIYTSDGSAPDPENLDGKTYFYKNQYPEFPGDPFGEFLVGAFRSHHYVEPVLITDRSGEPDSLTSISTTWHANPNYFPDNPVSKATVVRASAHKSGALPAKPVTHTFFVGNRWVAGYTLPVISLTLPETELFDYENGIYVAGIDYDHWRVVNPDATHDYATPANFTRRGIEWEKPAHFELFAEGYDGAAISQQLGIRIHGGEARRRPMKSLRLYARNNYGESHLNYQFFADIPDNSFKRIMLRNSGQDFLKTMMRDAAIQTIFKSLNFDTQDYEPAILFMNGEYWGIHNIRERYDNHYIERVYGVDPENIDYLYDNQSVSEGDLMHYQQTLSYIQQNGLAEEVHYEYITTRIDPDNFIDYQIANIYADNRDWPGNNLRYWRLRTDYNPDAPIGHDGRWRWQMFDMDFGFGMWQGSWAAQFNTLEFATEPGGTSWPNPDWSTFLLRSFLENTHFRNAFINRFADLLNTYFLPVVVQGTIEEIKQTLEPEMPEHIARWGSPSSIESWHNHVQVMIDFAELRPQHQRQHIADYFELPGTYEIIVDVSNPWHGHIRVNTIDVNNGTPGISGNPYPWSGIYFKDVPVELEATPHLGFTFSHWEGDVSGTDPIIAIMPQDDIYLVAHFVKDDNPLLIHYWLFDASLPNDTPLQSLETTYSLADSGSLHFHSALEGYPFDPDHPNWRKASMERRNAPTPINYRPEGNNSIPYENTDMRGIQIKQPFKSDDADNTLVFNMPTAGFNEVVMRFAAKDEGAADALLVDYSVTDDEPVWINEGLMNQEVPLEDNFELYEFDFTEIDQAGDNPNFKVRLRFAGGDMFADEGGRVTFNNISLDGLLISGSNQPPVVAAPLNLLKYIEGSQLVELDLNEVFMDPDNDPLTFSAESNRPEMVEVTFNGEAMMLNPVKRGDAHITITADDGYNEPVSHQFRMLVYPKAFSLAESNYSFTEWPADEPEYSYPEHIIFLQSQSSDPDLAEPLDFPYFIPHHDYHEDDQPTTGFPYNNTRRTRINGLGEEGVSFINTGQSRDLGGLLLALDTRSIEEATLSWLTETVQQNERRYGIRLQYRTDLNSAFNNVIINAQPVEYISNQSGDITLFENITLPQYLLGREYLQLLWRYYHHDGVSGARAELRLDDIVASDITGIHMIEPDKIIVYNYGDQLFVRLPEITSGEISVFDISGRLILTDRFLEAMQHSMNLRLTRGLLIVRIVTNDQVFVKKVMAY